MAVAKNLQRDLKRRDFLAITANFMLIAPAILQGRKVSAQEKNTMAESDDFQNMLKKWFAVRETSKAHGLLKRLTGDWNVRLRFYGGDQTLESRCASTGELIHDGRFLLERISGEVQAPDAQGKMRKEPFTATRILGYDNYKKAWTGIFIDNQNTTLMSFQGHALEEAPEKIELFGVADEPMLDLHDCMMKYVLTFPDGRSHIWTVDALAVGENTKVFEFEYSKSA